MGPLRVCTQDVGAVDQGPPRVAAAVATTPCRHSSFVAPSVAVLGWSHTGWLSAGFLCVPEVSHQSGSFRRAGWSLALQLSLWSWRGHLGMATGFHTGLHSLLLPPPPPHVAAWEERTEVAVTDIPGVCWGSQRGADSSVHINGGGAGAPRRPGEVRT